MKAFGWACKVCDGHDLDSLAAAFRTLPLRRGKPSWIICRTIKGKGVSFMENTVACHYGSVSDGQLAQALGELGEA